MDPRAGLLPPGLQCNRCTVHYLSNKTEDYVTVKAWGGVEFLCVCVCVCVCVRARVVQLFSVCRGLVVSMFQSVRLN